MKKIVFLLFAILPFVACQNTLELEKETIKDSEVFTAQIGGISSTKTIIDSLRVKWEKGDEIDINGVKYSATPNEQDARKATFDKTSAGDDPTSPYSAIYPSYLYVATPSAHYELPSSISYNAGKFNMPMYAESSDKRLSFKNIFTVLKISVDNLITVKSIAVSSDLYMNGTFTIASNVASIAEGTDENKTTTLNCSPAVSGTDFYVPVPAGTYTGKNLKIVLTKDDDSTETMSTNQNATIIMAAGTLYSFSFKKDGMFILESPEKVITKKIQVL